MHQRWVPPESRTPRSVWAGLARTPGGICRLCHHPIFVPAIAKRATVKDAIAHPRARVRLTFEEAGVLVHELKREPPQGLRLYTAARWHARCYADFLPRSTPMAAREALLAKDPRCTGCGLDLVALERRAEQARRAMRLAARRTADRDGHVPRAMVGWDLTAARFHPVALGLEGLGFDARRPLAEIDHVRPLWAGGEHEWRNLAVLCQPCHRAKSRREAVDRARLKKAHGRRRMT